MYGKKKKRKILFCQGRAEKIIKAFFGKKKKNQCFIYLSLSFPSVRTSVLHMFSKSAQAYYESNYVLALNNLKISMMTLNI